MSKMLSTAKRACTFMLQGLGNLRQDLSVSRPSLLRLIPDEFEDATENDVADPRAVAILKGAGTLA